VSLMTVVMVLPVVLVPARLFRVEVPTSITAPGIRRTSKYGIHVYSSSTYCLSFDIPLQYPMYGRCLIQQIILPFSNNCFSLLRTISIFIYPLRVIKRCTVPMVEVRGVVSRGDGFHPLVLLCDPVQSRLG